jgi:hypothetical protein
MTNMPLYHVHNVPKCCWTFETFLWWRYPNHISAHNINPRTQKYGIILLSLIVLPIHCCWEKLLLIILDWLMLISTHAHTSFWHNLVTQKWPKGQPSKRLWSKLILPNQWTLIQYGLKQWSPMLHPITLVGGAFLHPLRVTIDFWEETAYYHPR